MKAEELMIGDWVFYGEKPVQVLQLSKGKDYKYINPIPITPEILEKNGWFFKGRIWVKKGPMRLCWYPHNAGLIVDYHQLPFAVEYVHHLQHVQRMYGLEEIVL